MAEHHDPGKIGMGKEKFIPDPQQIVRILLFQRNAGPQPGMDKKKISGFKIKGKRL